MEAMRKHPYLFVFVVSALLGCIIFVTIYGTRILDGRNIDWILAICDDFTQSYLGWCFYRASDWFWPVGLMENAAYPSLTPILYIDSVPLFDLVFKILAPFLPETFQFFGIWGLACFALAGGVGGCIIYSLTENLPGAILSSAFFSLTTFAIQRLYTHTALAANWVILLSIFIVVSFERKTAASRLQGSDDAWAVRGVIARALCWFACFFLAVSVNIYYVPIIGVILLVYAFYSGFSRRRIVDSVAWLAGALVGTVGAFYLFGGFYHLGSTSVAPAGLGYYSANLNTLLNPMEYESYLAGFSTLLPTLPLAADGQYEGFAYLGAGLILLCALSCIGVIACGQERRRELFSERYGKIAAVLTASCLLFIAATGGLVAVNDAVLVQIDYPQPILSAAAVFRSSGRFAWGVWDIVAVAAIAVVLKTYSRRTALSVVLVAAIVQCVDLAGVALERHSKFAHPPAWSEEWDGWNMSWSALDKLMEGKGHLVYVDDSTLSISSYYDTAFAALGNDASISDFYYSRKDDKAISAYKDSVRSDLDSRVVDSGTLYLFSNYEEAARHLDTLHMYWVDGFICGASQPVEGFDEIASIEHVAHENLDGCVVVDLDSEGHEDNSIFALVVEKEAGQGVEVRAEGTNDAEYLVADQVVNQFRTVVDGGSPSYEVVDATDVEGPGVVNLYSITLRG